MVYRTVTKIDTKQFIFSDDGRLPLLGANAPEDFQDFDPWVWDERYWADDHMENLDIHLPRLTDLPSNGIPLTYWQSGPAGRDDLLIERIRGLRSLSREYWTPLVRYGDYFKYYEKRHLFSDRAVTQMVDVLDNGANGNERQLTEIPKHAGTIWAVIWARDAAGRVYAKRFIERMSVFSGVYDATGELDTGTSETPIWANVDTLKHEFVVDWTAGYDTPPNLVFNKDFTWYIGPAAPIAVFDDLDYCEYLGESDGDDTVLFTKYFPVHDNAELELWMDDGLAVPTDETANRGITWELDTDRGEISFIITPAANIKYFATYRPAIEVEYESEFCHNYHTLTDVNLNPLSTPVDKGFIFLTEKEQRVAYITLEASDFSNDDAALISPNTYGPLYLGADWCYLVATAYNRFDETVAGTDITLSLTDTGSGRLNGSTLPVVVRTNGDGQSRVVYSTPRSISSVGQYVTAPAGASLTLNFDNGITAATSLDDFYIFQIWDDDGQINNLGVQTQPGMSPWYEGPFGLEPGRGGRKVVLYSDTQEPPDVPPVGGVGDLNYHDDITDGLGFGPAHPRKSPGDLGYVGAVMPIRPIGIVPGPPVVLNFGISLPATEVMGTRLPNATVVSYWVVGPRFIGAIASAFSTLYQKTVTSDQVDLQLQVAPYLRGVHISTAIGREIPYGFRIYDAYGTAASGLDGANFLSLTGMIGKFPVVWGDNPVGPGPTGAGLEDTAPTIGRLGHYFDV